MSSKISIIVPVFNIKNEINQCIQSLISQTYKNIEIVLVDDGSTDGSEKIIDEYKKYSNIKIIHKQNGGLSSAKNTGLDITKGDYIAFVDGDDYVSPTYLEDMLNAIKNSDICICDYFEYFENLDIDIYHNEIQRSGIIKKENYWKNPYNLTHELLEVSWNKLYKGKIFDNLRFDEGKYHEDEFIIHNIIERCKNISILNKQLYYYKHRSGSIMNSYNLKKMIDALEAAFNRFKYYINTDNNHAIKQSSIYLFEMLTKCYMFTSKCEDKNILDTRNKIYEQSKILIKQLSEDKIGSTYYRMNLLLKYNPITAFNKYQKLLSYKKIANKLKDPKTLTYYNSIKRKLKHLKKDDVLFIGSPTYGNLGDQAIALTMIKFIKSCGKNVIDIPYDYYQGLKYRIPKNTPNTIVLIGGGNMGDVYLNEERLRRDVISSFKSSKIIIFPQTIYFTDTEKGKFELSISKKIYSSHNNLYIFAREETSFDIMKKEFNNCDINLCTDIVLWNKQKKKTNKGKYVLKILRNDLEKIDHTKELEQLDKEIKENNYQVKYIDTNSNRRIEPWERKKELKKIFKVIDNSRYVITDRLHGLIFSYIRNKKYYALPNYNQKVTGTLKLINENKLDYSKLKELI